MVTVLQAVGLERITPKYIHYISMKARTNRGYNERGSRTIYVRSSIPHCIWSVQAFYRGTKCAAEIPYRVACKA